ncbi:porin family protein [Lacinutrix sp. Hel_I_90]|uniref:porin family protein n=1 Tax=Lacinutrix sp. Hel_I_90 TaxID=1249999 RepID=UPI001E3D40D4|nr:porin family protein [Lacinutrix sp. Hel_I_90]
MAQETNLINDKAVDSLYKEDQFYIGVTYNLLGKKPSGLSQNGFSSGFHFGFIKDMPFNERRNNAIGVGLGLSFNSFNQNLLISESEDKIEDFQMIDDGDIKFSKNKFSMYMLELPIEYRWRTSTPSEYKFWRIYTGLRIGYVFASSSKFEGTPENVKLSNINALNSLQYGASISAGYNTWNFYVYYGLNAIFKSQAKVNTETIEVNAIKVGLMFYIL